MELPSAVTGAANQSRVVLNASFTASTAAWLTLQPAATRPALLALLAGCALVAAMLHLLLVRARGADADTATEAFNARIAARFGTRPLRVMVVASHRGVATLDIRPGRRHITLDVLLCGDADLTVSTLAHEYAHLVLGHHRRGFVNGAVTVFPVVTALLPVPLPVVCFAAFVGAVGAEARNLRVMRRDEFAADEFALRVLGTAFLPGAGRLLDDPSERGGRWSTHPAGRERLRRLRRQAALLERAGVLRHGPVIPAG